MNYHRSLELESLTQAVVESSLTFALGTTSTVVHPTCFFRSRIVVFAAKVCGEATYAEPGEEGAVSVALGFLGLVIVAFTVTDVLITTLAVNRGGGPLTARVGGGLWQAILRRHRANPSHRLLSVAAVVIILVTIVLWALLVLIGWSLIFTASEAAVVNAQTGVPADFWSRVYFAGFSLITLGTGDYRPQGALWQLASVLAAANGFFLITLTITYLAPIVSAATQRREVASFIASLGRNPYELLHNAWNGKNFSSLTQPFLSLAPMLALYGQQHLAYPVLNYFHSRDRKTAATVSIAVLYEALVALEGVPKECRPDALALKSLQLTLSDFLDTLSPAFIEAAHRAPPPPELERLAAQGIPTLSDEAFSEAVEGLEEQRRLLLDLIQNDGWFWQNVYAEEARKSEGQQ